MKIDGNPFKNSDTCEGISFSTPDPSLDLAAITITGRYPESGWAMNEVVREMVYIESGTGELLYETGETTSLKLGDVVTIDSGTWFAWNGDMKIIMACQPAFHPNQYKIKEHNEI